MHDLLSLSMEDKKKMVHFSELEKEISAKKKDKGKSKSKDEPISDVEREEGFINAVDKLRQHEFDKSGGFESFN